MTNWEKWLSEHETHEDDFSRFCKYNCNSCPIADSQAQGKNCKEVFEEWKNKQAEITVTGMSREEFENFMLSLCCDDYIVKLRQRYHSKQYMDSEWTYSNELLLGDGEDGFVYWENDWWEGQQDVEIIGYMRIYDLDLESQKKFIRLRKQGGESE